MIKVTLLLCYQATLKTDKKSMTFKKMSWAVLVFFVGFGGLSIFISLA